MTILTVRKSFILDPHGKETYMIPVGAKLSFIKETYHFYHAYYESHNYKFLVHDKGNPIEISVHRVHGSKTFKLLHCKPTHGDKNKIYWQDLFEEECPLSVK